MFSTESRELNTENSSTGEDEEVEIETSIEIDLPPNFYIEKNIFYKN